MCDQDPTADLAAGRIRRRLRAANVAADVVEIPTGERHRAPQHGPFAWHVLTAAAVVTVAELADVERAAAHLAAAGFAVDADGAALTVTLPAGAEIAADLDAVPVVEAEAAPPVLVVIPCGKDKRAEASPAGDLYTGAAHRMARAAADALADRIPDGARVVILSALHGLVDLADVLAPYDVTFPAHRPALAGPDAPGTVTRRTLAAQLTATGARTVVALTPNRYTERLALACRDTGAELVAPLAGSRGIGDQRGRLASIRDGRDLAAAVLDAAAGPAPVSPAESAPAVVELVEEPGGQFALAA